MSGLIAFLESFDVVLLGLLALAAVYWADPIGGRDE
jgi:hypothetical protein